MDALWRLCTNMFAVDKLAYTLKIDLDHINVCIYVHVDLVAFLPLLPIIVTKFFMKSVPKGA